MRNVNNNYVYKRSIFHNSYNDENPKNRNKTNELFEKCGDDEQCDLIICSK